MTDLELLDRWCEESLAFPHPLLFRDIQSRGLLCLIESLPNTTEAAKAEIRLRLQQRIEKLAKIAEVKKQSAIENVNRLNNHADAAADFYRRYELPFKYDVGEKEVLSGLSERSWGDGRRKNTVIHLLVEEDWTQGRMKRKAGDFLCTSLSGSNGNGWSGQNLRLRAHNGENQEYTPAVTCKQCLKMMNKYAKNNLR